MSGPGKAVVVSTPIGNLGDLSPRAVEALKSADFWLVEDTRVSGKLQASIGSKRPMRVLNEHSTDAQVSKFVDEIESGSVAAVLSDGGCPIVSDPGAQLVDACLERGIEVDAIPGPSAVTTALMLSGFFGQRFAFLGFLPRKPGPMKTELDPFAESSLTLIAFESPFRIDALLRACFVSLGARRYALCREISKFHQQVFRSELPIIPTEKEVPRKGEFTIVIEGRRRSSRSPRTLEV